MLDRVEKKLNWPGKKSVTASLHIHGYSKDANEAFQIYGWDAGSILRIDRRKPAGLDQ